MQIVIDIPEEIYKASQILDVKYEDGIQIPLEVIANGIPLPKGHGRLVDVDKLKEQATKIKLESLSKNIRVITRYKLENALTIIEADKESEK
jgi:hypothetical protein